MPITINGLSDSQLQIVKTADDNDVGGANATKGFLRYDETAKSATLVDLNAPTDAQKAVLGKIATALKGQTKFNPIFNAISAATGGSNIPAASSPSNPSSSSSSSSSTSSIKRKKPTETAPAHNIPNQNTAGSVAFDIDGYPVTASYFATVTDGKFTISITDLDYNYNTGPERGWSGAEKLRVKLEFNWDGKQAKSPTVITNYYNSNYYMLIGENEQRLSDGTPLNLTVDNSFKSGVDYTFGDDVSAPYNNKPYVELLEKVLTDMASKNKEDELYQPIINSLKAIIPAPEVETAAPVAPSTEAASEPDIIAN